MTEHQLATLFDRMPLLKCIHCTQQFRSRRNLWNHQRNQHKSLELTATTVTSTNSTTKTFRLPNVADARTPRDVPGTKYCQADHDLGTELLAIIEAAIERVTGSIDSRLQSYNDHILKQVNEHIASLKMRPSPTAVDLENRVERTMPQSGEESISLVDTHNGRMEGIEKRLHVLEVMMDIQAQKLRHVEDTMLQGHQYTAERLSRTEDLLKKLQADGVAFAASRDKTGARLDLRITEQQYISSKCRDGFRYVEKCLRQLTDVRQERMPQFEPFLAELKDLQDVVPNLEARLSVLEHGMMREKQEKKSLQAHILAVAIEKVREVDRISNSVPENARSLSLSD